MIICDVIKPNELELANIDFLDKTNNSIQFPLYCIVLSTTINLMYLCDRMLNFDGVFSVIQLLNWGIQYKQKQSFYFCPSLDSYNLIASHL